MDANATIVTPRQPAPATASELDLEALILRCQQELPKEPGWPHSIALSALGKESGLKGSEILDFLVSNGIPEKPIDPKKPYVTVGKHFVKIKQSGKGMYFQVLPPKARKSK